jgi:endonuclease VIII
MPEGPEVRRHAENLDDALNGEPITAITARARAAKAWLIEHPETLLGRRIERVFSRGKNLIGLIEGGYFWHSHLMMWGRWQVGTGEAPVERDRRERARISTPHAYAILFSAPIFEIGEGDPFEVIPYLTTLGPDILPYPGEGGFSVGCFQERLLARPERTIGAALLDQTVVAGIGNYLRAEILFVCRQDPWKPVGMLTEADLSCLSVMIPFLAEQACRSGVTVPDEQRQRMRKDASLRYPNATDWGTRHYVFRRTNLPCLVCGTPIRQKRQVTWSDEEGEKERIIYYCPTCQHATPPERETVR